MSERNAFLKFLSDNEDDTTTRLVYADWLDDHGEHEEADRQRKWPAAKEWLVRFCEASNSRDDSDPYEWMISYKDLIELGQEAIDRADKDGEVWLSCGNNMTMCYALQEASREFWKNWSIVTGIPVPSTVEDNCSYRCAC